MGVSDLEVPKSRTRVEEAEGSPCGVCDLSGRQVMDQTGRRLSVHPAGSVSCLKDSGSSSVQNYNLTIISLCRVVYEYPHSVPKTTYQSKL